MMSLFDSVLTTILTLSAIVAGIVYWYFVNTFNYWKKKGVPYIPPTPFFGNTKDVLLMRRNYCHVHQDLYKHFEGQPYAGIFQSRTPTLLLRDPELIKAILVKDFQHFHDRDIDVNTDVNPLLQHLFLLHGNRWRGLRSKLTPTFTSGRMKNMYPVMEECSKNFTSYLQDYADRKEILEMKEVFAKFTTDVIGTCAFGLQMNAMNDPDSEFRSMGRRVFQNSIKKRLGLICAQMMPQLATILRLDILGEGISEFFTGVVKETIDFRLKNNVKRNDFIQLLMNLRYHGKVDDTEEEPKKQRDDELEKNKAVLDFEFDDGLMAAQAFVFFFAGFETSSSAMSFAIQELAINPDIQEKLRADIDDTVAAHEGKLTYEAIMSMKYLDKVVTETLRLYPPVQFLTRRTTISYTIPGTSVHLEKGSSIVIPVYAIHRDAKHYQNPEQFDPERWSEEEKVKRHHYVYLPFGEGPRNCIGMRFGLLQTKLGLAALLSKYQFQVCERTEIPIRINPKSHILASTTGINVRIANRS